MLLLRVFVVAVAWAHASAAPLLRGSTAASGAVPLAATAPLAALALLAPLLAALLVALLLLLWLLLPLLLAAPSRETRLVLYRAPQKPVVPTGIGKITSVVVSTVRDAGSRVLRVLVTLAGVSVDDETQLATLSLAGGLNFFGRAPVALSGLKLVSVLLDEGVATALFEKTIEAGEPSAEATAAAAEADAAVARALASACLTLEIPSLVGLTVADVAASVERLADAFGAEHARAADMLYEFLVASSEAARRLGVETAFAKMASQKAVELEFTSKHQCSSYGVLMLTAVLGKLSTPRAYADTGDSSFASAAAGMVSAKHDASVESARMAEAVQVELQAMVLAAAAASSRPAPWPRPRRRRRRLRALPRGTRRPCSRLSAPARQPRAARWPCFTGTRSVSSGSAARRGSRCLRAPSRSRAAGPPPLARASAAAAPAAPPAAQPAAPLTAPAAARCSP